MITIVTKTRKEKINHFGGKKMKKKLLSVMLVGALAISALTGCGSKETASDDSQKTGTQQRQTAAVMQQIHQILITVK